MKQLSLATLNSQINGFSKLLSSRVGIGLFSILVCIVIDMTFAVRFSKTAMGPIWPSWPLLFALCSGFLCPFLLFRNRSAILDRPINSAVAFVMSGCLLAIFCYLVANFVDAPARASSALAKVATLQGAFVVFFVAPFVSFAWLKYFLIWSSFIALRTRQIKQ